MQQNHKLEPLEMIVGGAAIVVGVVSNYILIRDYLRPLYQRRFVNSLIHELQVEPTVSHYLHLREDSRRGLEILSTRRGRDAHRGVLNAHPLIAKKINNLMVVYLRENVEHGYDRMKDLIP